MARALGNAQPRGRGRGRVERLPGGNLPRGGRMPTPKPGQSIDPGFSPKFPGGGNGNGGTPAPAAPRGRGRGQRGVGAQGKGQGAVKGKGVGVGGGALPGPGGRQLAARVSSGAITQEQAQKTMQQRQTLAKAFGPDWREKISGGAGGKSFADVNAGLKKNPKDPKLAALRKKLLEGRKSLLEKARAKGKGGHEETEGED